MPEVRPAEVGEYPMAAEAEAESHWIKVAGGFLSDSGRLLCGGRDWNEIHRQPVESDPLELSRFRGRCDGDGLELLLMSLGTLLLILVILMLVGAFPSWPHSKGWGYYPSGGLGLVLLIVLILVLTGRL